MDGEEARPLPVIPVVFTVMGWLAESLRSVFPVPGWIPAILYDVAVLTGFIADGVRYSSERVGLIYYSYG